MLRAGAFLITAMAVLTAASTPPAAPSTNAVLIGVRMADTAARLCVPILSGDTAWPADLAAQDKLLASMGVVAGLPQDALPAMGNFSAMFNRATLASDVVGADGFAVALGGAQPVCRLVLFKSSDATTARGTALAWLNGAQNGWTAAPGSSPAAVTKSMYLRRSKSGKPMLLNVLTPTDPAAKPFLVMTVAVIPPNVQLPKGF